MVNSFIENFGISEEKIFSASAHGRMDVMGGIADYSGSLVLQMPIKESTNVSIRANGSGFLKIKSFVLQEIFQFEINIEQINSIKIGDYNSAKKLFQKNDWASYIVGCLVLLKWEKNISLEGFDILIKSNIPIGKGVSSSAALEVATLKVFSEKYKLSFVGTELPILAQKVENYIVGAPCGLMDQLASYFGKSGFLLPITCQPDILHDLTPLDKTMFLVGIDSGVKHSVAGNEYGKVRTAAFMGYSIIASLEGFDTKNIKKYPKNQLPFSGFLANISTSIFIKKYARKLPKLMLGKDFITQYGEIIDDISQIIPMENYPIYAATRHPIFENDRNIKFKKYTSFLSNPTLSQNPVYRKLGNLMDASHKSYSECGLGSERTDEIVEMVNQNLSRGVYGAKITGGGSGGTVCILCKGEEGKATAKEIWQQYEQKHGIEVAFFE
jgi:galactokinase